MEDIWTQYANKILALRSQLPATRNPIERKYRAAVLSLCREITEGPIDARFGPISPEKAITED
jgi:hypothetical protein